MTISLNAILETRRGHSISFYGGTGDHVLNSRSGKEIRARGAKMHRICHGETSDQVIFSESRFKEMGLAYSYMMRT